ncbi:MAG: hypothetical protein HY790_10745 [Deltaproteobacteria bacterium]|nr:hypothetical protein [Deltaproteobacteria bacterium]
MLRYISGFFLRPKVRISYSRGNAGSSEGPGNSLTLKWNYNIILDNLTNNHALELEIIYTGNLPSIALTESHIRGLTRITINQQLKKPVDRDMVIRSRHDFWGELLPEELRNIELCLRYKNEKGVTFYTIYKKENESETNSYSIFKCKAGTARHHWKND